MSLENKNLTHNKQLTNRKSEHDSNTQIDWRRNNLRKKIFLNFAHGVWSTKPQRIHKRETTHRQHFTKRNENISRKSRVILTLNLLIRIIMMILLCSKASWKKERLDPRSTISFNIIPTNHSKNTPNSNNLAVSLLSNFFYSKLNNAHSLFAQEDAKRIPASSTPRSLSPFHDSLLLYDDWPSFFASHLLFLANRQVYAENSRESRCASSQNTQKYRIFSINAETHKCDDEKQTIRIDLQPL